MEEALDLSLDRLLMMMMIKIYIKIAITPTCFGVITIIRERTCELAKL